MSIIDYRNSRPMGGNWTFDRVLATGMLVASMALILAVVFA